MGSQGNTTVDFGAFPGSSHAKVTVTGQAGIVAGSAAEAWVRAEASADHSADEHVVETIQVRAAEISAGNGFTIHAWNTSQLNEPVLPPVHETSVFTSSVTAIGVKTAAPGAGSAGGGGQGTRLYGVWNVSWCWN